MRGLYLRFGGKVSEAGRARLGDETESDLLLRVRSGEMHAFAELAERNRGPGLAVARSIVDAATAEDVVADSFERLLISLKRGEGPTYSLRPYFLQMVRNRAIDYKRRTLEIPVDTADDGPVVLGEESDSLVRNAFEALPERWQAALWLNVVEDRSHAEIGRELDVAEGAASQLLHRAREGLRQSYLDAQVGTEDECTRLRGLMGKYVRGHCSARDARKVTAHLADCKSCQVALSRTRQLNARLGSALAVSVLGGVGLELMRRPGSAMAAELVSHPARAIVAAKTAGTFRHVVGMVAGLAIVAGLVLGVPANSGTVQADAMLKAQPKLGPVRSASSARPTPTPSSTPSPTQAEPKPAEPKPSPSCPKSCKETATPSPSPSASAPAKSPTPSPTPTRTPTPTPTPSPSPSPCETVLDPETEEPICVVPPQ